MTMDLTEWRQHTGLLESQSAIDSLEYSVRQGDPRALRPYLDALLKAHMMYKARDPISSYIENTVDKRALANLVFHPTLLYDSSAQSVGSNHALQIMRYRLMQKLLARIASQTSGAVLSSSDAYIQGGTDYGGVRGNGPKGSEWSIAVKSLDARLYLQVFASGSDYGKSRALMTWMQKRIPAGSRRYTEGYGLDTGVVEGPRSRREPNRVYVWLPLKTGDWEEVQDGMGQYRAFITGLVNFVNYIDTSKQGGGE